MSKFKKEIVLQGYPVSGGISMGNVFIHNELDVDLTHSDIPESAVEYHLGVFRDAIEKTKKALRTNIQVTSDEFGDEFSDIFLGQLALIEDDYFLKEVEDEISNDLINAEAATFKIFSSKKDYFLKLDNEYFKDRAFDLHDLKKQIIYHIHGETKDYSMLAGPSIIVAQHISPSDTINYKRENILGFVTEIGGRTSHTAILSRSLNIPNISGIKNIHTLFEQNAEVILDGLKGKVIVHPFEETKVKYEKKYQKYQKYLKKIREYAKLEPVLKDGTTFEIAANVEFLTEIEEFKTFNVNSIGLYRSEGYFLANNTFPNEKTQYKEYNKIKSFLADGDVVIRTLDIGGDKMHQEFQKYKEDNPFLGFRAIRVSLAETEMFRTQLRAILRASANSNFKLMFPMITDISEIRDAKALVEEVCYELEQEDIPFKKDIEIGIMIETPISALLADSYAKEVDFFSIGTNDLVQYSLAVDRGNEKVSYLYQENHPGVLKIIKHVIDTAKKNNIWVSMCGEMASEPLSFPILLGMGLRKFSMTLQKSLTIKRMMTEMTIKDCEKLYKQVSHADNYTEVNYIAESWVKKRFPDLYI